VEVFLKGDADTFRGALTQFVNANSAILASNLAIFDEAEVLAITNDQEWVCQEAAELSPNLGDGRGQAAAA
jgi:hypothetical protein